MKRRFVQRISPRRYRPALLDVDLRITRRGRLRLRLIVLPSKRAFDDASEALLGHRYRRGIGLVNPLYTEFIRIGRDGAERRRREYDRRYFALMLLDARAVRRSTEIVAHECGHAALFYAERARGFKWQGRVERDDEAGEAICYPLGRIFRAVNIALHDGGVWR